MYESHVESLYDESFGLKTQNPLRSPLPLQFTTGYEKTYMQIFPHNILVVKTQSNIQYITVISTAHVKLYNSLIESNTMEQ